VRSQEGGATFRAFFFSGSLVFGPPCGRTSLRPTPQSGALLSLRGAPRYRFCVDTLTGSRAGSGAPCGRTSLRPTPQSGALLSLRGAPRYRFCRHAHRLACRCGRPLRPHFVAAYPHRRLLNPRNLTTNGTNHHEQGSISTKSSCFSCGYKRSKVNAYSAYPPIGERYSDGEFCGYEQRGALKPPGSAAKLPGD
jgi:hypothetical protein